MSVKAMAVAMVAGGGLVIFLGTRGRHDDEPPPPAPPPKVGPKWIPQEAAAQLVGSNAQPGPLFDGLTLGGAAPTDAQRARVTEFANKNDADIDLEARDGKLAAIRVGVTFKGGYGLEGADVFALRLHRPSTGHCCVCGEDTWIDSWSFAEDNDLHLRARVKKNRVEARWERTSPWEELLARGEDLLGKDVIALHESAGDRWHEMAPHEFLLEAAMPYPQGYPGERDPRGADLGFLLTEQAGKIVEVTLQMRQANDDYAEKMFRTRWGQPRVSDEGSTWTWRRHDRVVEVRSPGGDARVAIRHPGYHPE